MAGLRFPGALRAGLLLAALLSPAAFAQMPPAGITVTGQAVVYGVPDQASFSVGINELDADVSAAVARANERVAAIMAALQESGVAEADIRTSDFSVWREDRVDASGEEAAPVFRAMNSVTVTVRDIATLGDLLSASLDAGANQIHSVNFFIAETGELESEARGLALADAQEKAEQLASLAGLTLGQPVSIAESGPAPADWMQTGYGAAMARESVPVAPGELSVSVAVTVTYGLTDGE